MLGRRGFAFESAAEKICQEAGRRVTLNVMVRDMDLALPHAQDSRCLEIVADGLPCTAACSWLWTPPSCHHSIAEVQQRSMERLSQWQDAGRNALNWPSAWARLVVLAGEVRGRWSDETHMFLGRLGPRKSQIGATRSSGQDRTGLEVALGFHLGMQCSPDVRCIAFGPQAWGWRGW